MLKRNVDPDGYLGDLHTLLLMDDMVILATSREKCLQKLADVLNYCREYMMVLNEKKKKFFVIHGSGRDTNKVLRLSIHARIFT